MLGYDLVKQFTATGDDVYGLSRTKTPHLPERKQILMDLAAPVEKKYIQEIAPDVIIHAAALTDLSFCEKSPDVAHQVHVNATRSLSESIKKGGTFYYISTDAVFDGVRGDYKEADVPNAVNIYASTKLLGEQSAREYCHGTPVILRTNIYGVHVPRKQSLAEWAIAEWQKGQPISGFDDMVFNAVHTNQLASILRTMVGQRFAEPIVNVGSSEYISKFQFLLRLRGALGLDEASAIVNKAISDEFKSSIKRPKNTTLNTSLLSRLCPVPTFEDGLNELVAKLKET